MYVLTSCNRNSYKIVDKCKYKVNTDPSDRLLRQVNTPNNIQEIVLKRKAGSIINS